MTFDLTAWRDRYPALKKNLTDVILESQIKLGIAEIPIGFYYPLESLERLLGMERTFAPDPLFDRSRLARMQAVLEDFAALNADTFGALEVSHDGGRFCLRVPGEGARIIHETVPEPAFLTELIRTVGGHPQKREEITELFRRHASAPERVVCREIGGEFDLLLYFADGVPDDYRYCVKFEGEDAHGLHVIYHRFTPEDYEALGIEGNADAADPAAAPAAVICFGDSNTYGYDGGQSAEWRYGPDVRWVSLLARRTGIRFRNLGRNGREVPASDTEMPGLIETIEEEAAALTADGAGSPEGTDSAGGTDAAAKGPVQVWIMLGTNDILNGGASAARTAEKTAHMLDLLLMRPEVRDGRAELVLIAPVRAVRGSWADRDEVVTETAKLGGLYRELAAERGLRFFNAGALPVGLLPDGVHLSAEGHGTLAGALAEALLGA